MKRATLHRSLPFGAALLLGAAIVHASRQQPAGMQAKPVQGKVHWIEGTMGGNIGVLAGEDGALVVDTYVPGAREALSAAVNAAAGKGVRLVLNTHWHGDHTGNNVVWGGAATVLAHENVRRRLAGDSAIGGSVEDRPEPLALPIVTFEDGVGLHVAGENVRVRHYAAAHTDGDSVVFFEGSKVVHMGDLYFNGRFPFIDLASGGSVEGMIAAVGEILDGEDLEDGWILIPGHGPLAKKTDLERYHAMLQETSGLVREALATGKSLDEMKKEALLDAWKEWSWQFIDSNRYLEILVQGLSQKR